MTNRLFVLFALACALFIGCRSSAKSAQATPTPSPTPVAQVQELAPQRATPAQTQVPLGSPIPVTPPASYSAERVNGHAAQFIIQGHQGQFLRVKVNGEGSDPTDSVSVQAMSGSQRPLEAIRKGGDCSGNFVYLLPETGKYEIEFDPAGRQMGVAFTILASNDPMVDPGIRRDQLSINLGSLAPRKLMTLEPFSQWTGCMGTWGPSHWVWRDDHFEFRIIQVAGYQKALQDGSEKDDSMERLGAALKKGGRGTKVVSLTYPVAEDAALNVATPPTFIQWDGWSGLRWIGQYAQDNGCSFGDLSYVFEGLTNDGKFFVMMRVDVSNDAVADRLGQECKQGSQGKDFDEFYKKEMTARFEREVSSADPASFTPSLDQLDTVIRSLKLKP